jgi:hypothetical protein
VQSPREFPAGRLAQFQEHKIRLWTIYNLGLGRVGTITTGLLYRYDSPLTFSYAIAGVGRTAIQRSRNPGYRSLVSQTVFFGERGAGEFNATSLFDLSFTYSRSLIRNVQPWVKFDIRNVLNDDTLLRYNIAISFDPNSPLDEDGLRTDFIRNATFGRPASVASYVIPREYIVAAGIRF